MRLALLFLTSLFLLPFSNATFVYFGQSDDTYSTIGHYSGGAYYQLGQGFNVSVSTTINKIGFLIHGVNGAGISILTGTIREQQQADNTRWNTTVALATSISSDSQTSGAWVNFTFSPITLEAGKQYYMVYSEAGAPAPGNSLTAAFSNLFGAFGWYLDTADGVFGSVATAYNVSSFYQTVVYNTTWVQAVDELPVNGTTFDNGSSIGLQGYCSTNGTLLGATAWLWYYSNGTYAANITNTSGLTNATAFNFTFSAPALPLNYSWFLSCNATVPGALGTTTSNSSGRYFLTEVPAPRPTPTPSPSPVASPRPSGGGLTSTETLALIATGYCPECDYRCRPVLWCLPFTDLCFTPFKKCGDGWLDYEAYASG